MEENNTQEQAKEVESTKSKKKVLLVDDDAFLLEMYATKFQDADYEVISASSSEDVLEQLRNGAQPDIILLDLILPNMDGLDLLKTIRDEGLDGKAVVIMLTNQGGDEEIARAKELKADGYIVKATTVPSEVVAQVEKIYNKKS